jgi:hypothetical protein
LKVQISKLQAKNKESKLRQIKEVAKIPTQLKQQKSLSKTIKNKNVKANELNCQNEEENYSVKEWQTMFKRIALVEAENMKLTSKLNY